MFIPWKFYENIFRAYKEASSLALRIIHLIYDATLYTRFYPHIVFFRVLRFIFLSFARFLFSQPIRTCNTFRASSRRKLRVKPSISQLRPIILTSCIFSAAYIHDDEKVLHGTRGKKRRDGNGREEGRAASSSRARIPRGLFIYGLDISYLTP